MQNNTLVVKHITCFQLYDASKLSSELDGSRASFGEQNSISVVSQLFLFFLRITDTGGTVTLTKLPFTFHPLLPLS